MNPTTKLFFFCIIGTCCALYPSANYGSVVTSSETSTAPSKPSNEYGVPEKARETHVISKIIVPSTSYGVPVQKVVVPKKPVITYGVPSTHTFDFDDDDDDDFEEIIVPSNSYEIPKPQKPATTYGVPTRPTRPSIIYGVSTTVKPSTPAQIYGVPISKPKIPVTSYGVPAKSYGVPGRTSGFQFSVSDEYELPQVRVPDYGVPRRPSEEYGVPKKPTEEYGVPRRPTNEYGVPKRPSEEYEVPRK